MITAIVQYRLPPSIDQAACAAHFRKIAAGFRTVPGLIRKQFIYAEDGWAGGVYLWKTRADAEAFYSGPWLDGIRERYGMDPQIKDFNTACVTDNSIEQVINGLEDSVTLRPNDRYPKVSPGPTSPVLFPFRRNGVALKRHDADRRRLRCNGG